MKLDLSQLPKKKGISLDLSLLPEKVAPTSPVQKTNTGNYAPPAPDWDVPETKSGQKLPFQGGDWKDWLGSALNAPVDVPQAFMKETKPVLQQGLDNINNTLGLQPITDTLNDASDYKERKAQLENLDFRYRDLWTLAKSIGGNEQAKLDIQKQRQELDAQMADMFKQLGADSVQINEKGEMRVGKDGKYYELDDSLFDTLKEGVWASRGEVTSDIGGGLAGGYIANLINKDPRKKTASMVLGGLMGGASSSMWGRTVDMLRNANATRQKLTGMDILDAATDAGAGSAILGTGITTLGAAVAKPTKAVVGRVGDKIIQGNIGGAEQYAKEAGASLDEANDLLARQSQYEEIQQPWLSTVSNKRQDRLAALAQTNPTLANELATEIGNNPLVADGVRKNIDARARAVYAQLEKSASTPKQIRANIDGYIDGVSKQYEQTKEVLTEIAPEKTFDIQSSGIIEQIKGFEDLIGNVDSKNEVIALANRLTKKGKMGIDDLIEARQEINYILSKQRRYVGKEAINGIKDTIDTAIDDILSKTTAPEETKTALKKSIDDYRVMKEMTEGSAYDDIMKDTLTPEQFDQKIAHHAQTISKTLSDVTSKLKPEEKAGAEMRIILGLVQKATTDTGGFKAIDFPKLAQAIKSSEFATPEARQMADGLANMGDLFMQDIKLLRESMSAVSGKASQGLSWNPIIRARTMLANQFMNTVAVFMPKIGKSAAFQKHVGQSMTKSRTPMEFFQRIAEHPDAPESLLDKLRPIAKEMAEQRKAIEQERMQAEQLAKEERLAKEAAQKQALEEEVANFKTPSAEEVKAVAALTHDDRFASFAQMTVKIQDGTATPAEIEKYIKARQKIAPEKLQEAIEKNKPKTTTQTTSVNDDTPLAFANPSHMGVGAFTGTANAADDYENKTPEQMAMDFLKGFLGGTVASKVGAKALKGTKAGDFIQDLATTPKGGQKAGMSIDTATKSVNFDALNSFAEKIEKSDSVLKFVADFKKPIKTPIGDLKIDYDYMLNKATERDGGKRLEAIGYIKPTLERPAYIIENHGKIHFVKPYIDEKDKVRKFLSVVSDRSGKINMVTSTIQKDSDIKRLVKNGKVIEDFTKIEGGATRLAPVPPRADRSPKASNSYGKSIPQQAEKLKRDANFKKWFDGSKVVDDNGEPLVVYHGAMTGDRQFRGSNFFTEYKYTEQYAGKDTRYYPYRKNPDGTVGQSEEYFMQGGTVYPVYLDIKKPKTIPYKESMGDPRREEKIIEQAKKEGHDGLIIEYGNARKDYVTFKPTQIKSIHNQGTFNPKNPNILKGLGLGALGLGAASQDDKPTTKELFQKLGL